MSSSYAEKLKDMSLLIRAWQNMVHMGREWQTTSVFLLENSMNSMKMQKDMTLKYEPPRSVGVQYNIREEQRNSWRNNEEPEPKQKQHLIVIVFDGEK